MPLVFTSLISIQAQCGSRKSLLDVVISSDMSVGILTSWLCIQDIGNLDTAVCSKNQRIDLLSTISSKSVVFGSNEIFKTNTNLVAGTKFLAWLAVRGVHINHFVIPPILEKMDIRYLEILMKHSGNLITKLYTTLFVSIEMCDLVVSIIATHCRSLILFDASDLSGCHRITDDAIICLASGCSDLQSLNLSFCEKITDAAIINIADSCPYLKSLDLCFLGVTDVAIIRIADRCSNLQTLDLSDCIAITDAAIIRIVDRCSHLMCLGICCLAEELKILLSKRNICIF